MQIFSNAGQDEAEKIRDEAARLVGPDTRVPCELCCLLMCCWVGSVRVEVSILKMWVLIIGFGVANQAEFHEFNFGYDVVGESERLLERLLVG